MSELTIVYTFAVEILFLLGLATGVIVWIIKIVRGQRCELRHDMLDIYYKYKDTKKIHQYDYEDFVYLYEAYKALKGNSFIDKINDEIRTWEVVL